MVMPCMSGLRKRPVTGH